MVPKEPSIINIAFVGGGDFCREILEKTTAVYEQEEMYAPILAVADPDPNSPGMALADEYGLLTFQDYHQLYDRRYNINLIIILTPEQNIFDDILQTRPQRIRILSYHVFGIFWNAIGREEHKLRERTNEMETILNGIQDFILVITPDMEIIDANESFLTKMRYGREDVIGKKCYQVYHKIGHPCNGGETDCPLKEVVRNKRQVRKIQTRLMPDGQKRYYEVNIYPIWEKDGKISKFIHISRDITQHKKEEEELTRRLEQMVEDRTRQESTSAKASQPMVKTGSSGAVRAPRVRNVSTVKDAPPRSTSTGSASKRGLPTMASCTQASRRDAEAIGMSSESLSLPSLGVILEGQALESRPVVSSLVLSAWHAELSAWRYWLRIYKLPLELMLLQKLFAYKRPETSGF